MIRDASPRTSHGPLPLALFFLLAGRALALEPGEPAFVPQDGPVNPPPFHPGAQQPPRFPPFPALPTQDLWAPRETVALPGDLEERIRARLRDGCRFGGAFGTTDPMIEIHAPNLEALAASTATLEDLEGSPLALHNMMIIPGPSMEDMIIGTFQISNSVIARAPVVEGLAHLASYGFRIESMRIGQEDPSVIDINTSFSGLEGQSLVPYVAEAFVGARIIREARSLQTDHEIATLTLDLD